MENSTGNTDKKFTTTSKNAKTEKNAGICWDEKRKATQQLKKNDTTRGDKSEGAGERRKPKMIMRRDKTIHTKNERTFYKQVRGECPKTNQQPVAREAKLFWSKIWERRDHNRTAEWINNMEKYLQGREEGPKAKIHVDSLRAKL